MTGDQQDVYRRLRGYLPPWFGDEVETPIINGLLNGLAYAGSYVYGLLSYARLQTRIKTATDGWLDMIAADFFGDTLLRAANQSDASFRSRIILNLFRERATRLGMVKALQDLTGRTPTIIEPTRPADTGAYGGTDSITVVGTPLIYRNDWQGNQLLYATARTNLALWSEALENSSWSKVRAYITTNVLVAPDGTTTMDVVVPDATNNSHGVNRSYTVTTGVTYTFSVFAKQAGYPGLTMNLPDASFGGGSHAMFDLVNGVATTGGAGNATISALPEGVFRCSWSVTAIASGSATMSYQVNNAYPGGAIPSFSGDGTSGIGMWGFLSEASEILTSYIPTTSAATTVTDYALTANGGLTLAVPPLAGAIMSWTGSYISTVQGKTVNVTGQTFAGGDGLTTSFTLAPRYGYGVGYGVAGAYGSMLMPFQCFVIAYRPAGTGIPNVAGYGISTGGYAQPSQADYASMSSIQGSVTDADIYAAIEATRPVATKVWASIQN